MNHTDTLNELGFVEDPIKAFKNARGSARLHNGATPKIEIDPAADGELLVCEPAERLAMVQRYFLF